MQTKKWVTPYTLYSSNNKYSFKIGLSGSFLVSNLASVGRPKIARPRPVLVPEFSRTTRPRPVPVLKI